MHVNQVAQCPTHCRKSICMYYVCVEREREIIQIEKSEKRKSAFSHIHKGKLDSLHGQKLHLHSGYTVVPAKSRGFCRAQ